ncbi:MAG: hypothetical protein OXN89_15655 [Bryobacterales bacterium]|nr:hypothetical protein [Bryobacterales bacterium]
MAPFARLRSDVAIMRGHFGCIRALLAGGGTCHENRQYQTEK